MLEGGQGDDLLAAGSVETTFLFAGDDLGADVITRGSKIGRNRLDFGNLAAGVNLDLNRAGPQEVSVGKLKLTLPDGETIQDVEGTSYDDFIVGNKFRSPTPTNAATRWAWRTT